MLQRTLALHVVSGHQENTTELSKLHQNFNNFLDSLVKTDNILNFFWEKVNYIYFYMKEEKTLMMV